MSKATVVVQFGDSVAAADQFSVIELDDTRNLDAEGNPKSQFEVGEEAVFLIHLPPGLYVDRIASTDGMVASEGSTTLTREQKILFVDDETQQLSYYPAGGVQLSWQGKVGGGFSRNGRDVSISANWPAKAKVAFPVSFSRYRLIPPPLVLAEDETYEIDVVIYVEASE